MKHKLKINWEMPKSSTNTKFKVSNFLLFIVHAYITDDSSPHEVIVMNYYKDFKVVITDSSSTVIAIHVGNEVTIFSIDF